MTDHTPPSRLLAESTCRGAGSGTIDAALETPCTSALRIQYASDLHLEFGDQTSFGYMLTPVAPYLALAGDIGRPDQQSYTQFLEYCSTNWQRTFVVAGNHELYNGGMDGKVDSAADRLSSCAHICRQFPNVHFMNRGRFELESEGVSVLGATLWTNLDSEEKQTVAQEQMNDYRCIFVDQEAQEEAFGFPHRLLTAADVLAWHRCDREWLSQEIAANARVARPAVVITHHLPTFRLIAPCWATSPLTVAFASECSELLTHPVRAWIAGHTHVSAHLSLGRMQLGVNPRGYPGDDKSGYLPSRCFDVDIGP